MAPTPEDDNHYEGGAPLDGGGSPASLAGGDQHNSPTGLEIGVITGVIVLVILTVVGIFIWRSRRIRAAKNAEAAYNDPPARGAHSQPADFQESDEPVPPPKDDLASTVGNDDRSSLERHARSGRGMNWNPWVRRGKREEAVEEHEIANRG
ncbi:hypothetical protein F4779DRAFT_635137 [Xylariaceae sp. FL0662B]|nr:hypothetical protein F4779DRAFT_635137 [Xylariaceae sp. FL0662B]